MKNGIKVFDILQSIVIYYKRYFTDMIITQQAFSANGKVVSVGTDLLDEVIRLIR